METLTDINGLQQVAAGFGLQHANVQPLGKGLIHFTYKAADGNQTLVLQQINTKVFADPRALIENYLVVYEHLKQNGQVKVPAPIPAVTGEWLWSDHANTYWRATEYIPDSYSPDATENAGAAYTTAKSFGRFTSSLSGLDTLQLQVLLANFHDLSYRYHQFEDVVATTQGLRLMRATHVIAELRQRKYLVDFYDSIKNNTAFPMRLMHHDCKIGNILFDANTGEVICPIDLDTIMPGKYFSDLGDMIRTMACTVDENSREWEIIDIRSDFYDAIVQGYLDGIGNELTPEEKINLHQSGLLMIFMQTLRFVTDFLQGDVYYRTSYPEQNLNRALNQLILLEKLEFFLAQRLAK
ncbi:MAG TPA: aminoglycoside phosphotransferase family protein [Chitinophagaceae bacterium]|nr:aminoglycoside phosphotransferase family protein [Chitinophagaceae bacterium]